MCSDVYSVAVHTADGSRTTHLPGFDTAVARARMWAADPATQLVTVRDRRGILVYTSHRGEVMPIA